MQVMRGVYLLTRYLAIPLVRLLEASILGALSYRLVSYLLAQIASSTDKIARTCDSRLIFVSTSMIFISCTYRMRYAVHVL
jgi:hypothetical protein